MAPTPSPTIPDVLVRKYGGSSLSTVERIGEVARDVRLARQEGYRLVVVVSAMGTTTDELAALALQANPTPPRRELDMLLSVGERIAMSLLSMALDREGCPAISYTGSQCGIITDASHTDAQILEVRCDRVRESLAQGYTVVVAGFQGMSRQREITTLGRGGSDTTAVALAAALGAVRCEILKDVDGVMSADPKLVPAAFKYDRLSWEQMRAIAASGCGVVHLRAVDYAAAHGVPLVVRSSFHDRPGTAIGETEHLAYPATAAPRAQAAGPAPAETRGVPRVPYRPLTLDVAQPVVRLLLRTTAADLFDRWRDRVLQDGGPERTLAEWLDVGRDFRWEILAVRGLAPGLAADLERDAAQAGPQGGHVEVQADLACLSLAGERPGCWLAIQRDLTGLLAGLGWPGVRVRADGASLRLILPQAGLGDLPRLLHRELLEA